MILSQSRLVTKPFLIRIDNPVPNSECKPGAFEVSLSTECVEDERKTSFDQIVRISSLCPRVAKNLFGKMAELRLDFDKIVDQSQLQLEQNDQPLKVIGSTINPDSLSAPKLILCSFAT